MIFLTTGRSEKLLTMTSLHSYRNGGFPPANKLLDKIWHHEDYKRHKKKVIKAFRPTIALLNTHVLCGASAQASAVKGRLHKASSPISARRLCHSDKA